MNKILITGGAGYIGAVLVPELLKAGMKVTVVDAFFHSTESLTAHAGLKILRGDVRDPHIMGPLLKEADFVLPLATVSSYDGAPGFARATNLDSLTWLIKNLSAQQCLIYPSAAKVYGNQIGKNEVDERCPILPLTPAGKDKADAEGTVLAHPNAAVLRFGTCFGISPRLRMDLIPNDLVFRAFTRRFLILPEAQTRRSFLHVRDAAAVFPFAIKKWDKFRGEIFNVAHPDLGISIWDLASTIQEQLPDCLITESTKSAGPDKVHYTLSTKKITDLGFKPKLELQAGISELIHGFRARGETRPSKHPHNKST